MFHKTKFVLRRRIGALQLSFLLVMTAVVSSSFADTITTWKTNFFPSGQNTISNNFSTGSTWNGGQPTGNNTALITNNNSTVGQTNISYLIQGSGGDYQMFGDNAVGVVISNSSTAGSGINKFLLGTSSGSSSLEMQHLTIGNNGIVEIDANTTIKSYGNGSGGGVGITMNGGGTLALVGGSFDWGQGDFILNNNAVIAVTSGGTLSGSTSDNGNNGNNALHLLTGAQIIVNSGSFEFNSGNAYNFGGLQLDSGSTITIDSGGAVVLIKYDGNNEWANGSPFPTNFGTVVMNGGSIAAGSAFGSIGNNGTLVLGNGSPSSGLIIGSGTIAINIQESSTTVIAATNGVLNIFPSVGSEETITAAGNSSMGTNEALVSGTLKIDNAVSGMHGIWLVNAGGTLEIAANADLGSSTMSSNLNGTVKVDAGDSFTLSTGAGSQQGVFQLGTNGATAGASLFIPNGGTPVAFTNAGLVTVLGNNGTLQSGFGSVGNGINVAFINTGSVTNNNSGSTLNLMSGTAGISNSGTIYIGGGATINFAGAVTGLAITNTGYVVLSGGTVAMQTQNLGAAVSSGNTSNGVIWNAGTISGSGLIIGTISNRATGSIILSGGYLTNDMAGAFAQAGTLNLGANNLYLTNTSVSGSGPAVSNSGQIYMAGGNLYAGVMTNTGQIIGFGSISNTVVNVGSIYATNLTANTFTLTINEASSINVAGATIGTIGTNAILNLLTPNSSAYFVNATGGVVSVSGGTIELNGTTGTITNFGVIAGVGNVSSLPLVNQAGASFIAQNPITGLNTLIATESGTGGITNNGILGANNVLNTGAATLDLSFSGGGSIILNNGTIALGGGFITNGNGGGFIVTNNSGAMVYGLGTQNLLVANMAGGNLMASSGIFRLSMTGVNAGTMSNFSSAATIMLTNTVLVNTGTIALNGGGLILGGSIITNDGIITGPGYYSSGLFNDTAGVVNATGSGLLAIATNGPTTEAVSNVGTISVQNASTLQVGGAVNVDWNNMTLGSATGQVIFSGGFLSGGNLTNQGVVSGFGTNLELFVNAAGGSVFATNGLLAFNGTTVSNAGFVTIGSSTSISTVSVANAWNNTGSITNNGWILAGNNLTNSGTIVTYSSNFGTISGVQFVNTNGTLVLSNNSTIVNLYIKTSGGGFNNAGTIQQIAGVGQSNSLNYGQTPSEMTNAGTIVKSGAGFAEFNGAYGNNNFAFENSGTIIVNGGTLSINPVDAFTAGGFSNTSTGFIQINAGTTFVINRDANAYTNVTANVSHNVGVINLNGGTLTVQFNGNQASDRPIENDATISGAGTLALQIQQGANGNIIASNGVLNIFQTVAGNQQTFTSVGGQFGTFKALAGGDLKINGNVASGMGGAWAVSAGGTVEVTAVNVDLGSSTMANFLNGMVLVDSGGNLTLSASANGQAGTFQLGTNGGSAAASIFVPNGGTPPAFTNSGLITVLGNNGTFQTGFGTQGNGVNVTFVNTGLVTNNSSGSILNLLSGTAGISNSGTIFIGNGATINFAGGNTGSGALTNTGNLILSGGTAAMQTQSLTAATASVNDASRTVWNTGTISGQGTLIGLVNNQSGGSVIAAGSGSTLTLAGSGTITQAGTLQANSGAYLVVTNVAVSGTLGALSNSNWMVANGGTIMAGAVNNSGTAQFSGGTVVATTFTNGSSSSVIALTAANSGTIAAGTIVNFGTVSLANGQTLTLSSAVFSNTATGALFDNGGNLVTTGSFYNVSTAKGTYSFSSGTLDFSGSGTKFLLAGSTDLGNGFSATNQNFMIGNLADTSGVTLQLAGAAYVNNLDLASGSTLNLGGTNLYFAGVTNIVGVTITGGTSANIIMLANVFSGGIVTFTNVTLAGTYNYDNLTNFDAGFAATNNNMQVFIGTTSANNITVTQNTSAAAFTVQSMTVSNGGSGLYTLVLGRNQTWSANSLEGSHGIVQITTNVTLTLGSTNTVASGGVFQGAGTISGGVLVVGAGGTVLATNIAGSGIVTQYWTSATAPVLNAGGTNMVAASSVLRFAGAVNNNGAIILNGGTLVTDSTLTNLSGGVISGGGEVIISSGAVVNNSGATITGNNAGQALDFAGAQTVGNFGAFVATNGGTLSFGGGSTIVTNAGAIQLVNGTVASGNLTNLAAGTISGAGTITGMLINQGTIESTNGTMVLTSNPVLTGTANVRSGGTLQFGATGGLLTVTNNGTISLYGGNVMAGTVNNQGNISTVNGGGLISNLVNAASGFVNVTNGTLTVSPNLVNAGVISNTTTLNVGAAGSGSVSNSGTIALAGGTVNAFVITNVGTISGNGAFSGGIANSGLVSVSGGVLTLSTGTVASINNLGTFAVASSGTLTVTPSWSNAGTVNLSGGTWTGGTVTNTGMIIGNGTIASGVGLVNTTLGTVKATNGNLNVLSTTVVQNGTLIGGSFSGPTLVITNLSQGLVNNGTMILDSPAGGATNVAFLILGGTFSNASGGLIQGAGFFTTGLGQGGANSPFVNQGMIAATNGALIVNPGDTFIQGGFVNGLGATVMVASASSFGIQRTLNSWSTDVTNSVNLGTVLLNGGSLTFYTNSTLVDNTRVLSNGVSGLISGSGTIMGSLINVGTINATNGNLNVNNGTNFVQNGTISIQSGGTLTILGTTAVTNNGQILFYGGSMVATNVGQPPNGNSLFNAGTLEGQGVVNLGVSNTTGGANAHLLNTGNLIATNWGGATPGTLYINTGNAFSGGGFENLAGGVVQIATNMTLTINRSQNAWSTSGNAVTNLGQIALGGGTLNFAADGAQTNAAGFINNGSITGFGVVVAALTNGLTGTIAPSGGTLVMDGSGGFGNSGTILVNTGTALVLTNFAATSGLSFTNAGIILMQGGLLQAGVISSTNTIQGYGTIAGGGVANSGTLLANATNLTTVGTLTVTLTSFTNISSATLGVIGTNTILNVLTPNNTPYLVNLGTINVSAGTITNTLAAGLVISNQNVISGVGTLSSLPVVNAIGSSIIAQNPIQGISNFYVAVSATNISGSTLGANNIGGAATLSLSTSNGVGLVNNGTIQLNGGFISVNNGASEVTNLTGQIYGSGLQSNLNVVNLSGGSVVASNGTLRLGMLNNSNSGVLSNYTGSTLLLTNTILVNAASGKILLNGGGLIMGGSVITNEGLIQGPGNYSSGLYNDTAGTVLATNGTLAIATNGPATEAVVNLGTMTIQNASTLQVGGTGANAVTWNNTNGTVNLLGGSLAGGSVTNNGMILGNGTIVSGAGVFNASAGTIKATNGVLAINAANFNQNSGTMIGGTTNGTYLQTTNIVGFLVNNGTMILDSPLNGSTNLAFYVLHDVTNAVPGVITGAGIFRTGDGLTSGGLNSSIFNAGLIAATNGALLVDTGNAFNNGFNNLAGGTVTVANASTFGIVRTTNAWVNDTTNPVNNGAILLNGGVVATYTNNGTGPTAAPVLDMTRSISNAVGGVISGNGSLNMNLVNLGTVNATNGTLVLAGTAAFTQSGTLSIQNNATFTTLQNTGNFQNNGTISLLGGTFVGTNFNGALVNAGTISGNGSFNTGRLTGQGGASQNIINNAGGTIIATNGTLLINPGDSFAQGGFSNAANGTVVVANGATLELNRTANAWNNLNNGTQNPRNLGTIKMQGGSFVVEAGGVADASRFIENVSGGLISGSGTISASLTNFSGAAIDATGGGTLALVGSGAFLQAGTLEVDASTTMLISNATAGSLVNFANGGTIFMNGGTLAAGSIANNSLIFGNGTIAGVGVANSGLLLASNGTLFTALSSFTNASTATIGTLSTNATLNAQLPVGSGSLLNQGTISMQGGTLLLNNVSGITITNANTGYIVGVGDLSGDTIANSGTILADNPVNGLTTFSVGLKPVNSATLEASNGATLNIVLSGGPSFSNNGSISMIGGSLVINNGTGGTITNNAWISGVGTIVPGIVNNSNIIATVNAGVLDVTLFGGTNSAIGNLLAGSNATVQVENSLVNLGTIAANGTYGGFVQMAQATGVITNQGTIVGSSSLTFNSFVQNGPLGTIYATNGVVNFNAANGLGNSGTIIVLNGGTLQSNSSNSWANAGTINMLGGTMATGGFTNGTVIAVFTNSGTISGYGTIIGGGAFGLTGAGIDKSIVNLGTIIATNMISNAAQTLYITTGGATLGGGIQNLGTMIVSSNNTLVLDRGGLPVLNTGTITINNGTLQSSSTITNTVGGIVDGYGTLTAAIVNQAGGIIAATNGILTMTGTVFPINQGTFAIANGATMTWDISNSWVNSGIVDIRGGTLRTGGFTNAATVAAFTNSAGATIIGFGTIDGGGAYNTNGVGIDKSIVNLGTVIASNGVLTLNTGFATSQRGLANLGTMIVATTNDTLVLARQAEINVNGNNVTNLNYLYNSGTIIINGGTLTSDTSITNNNESAGLPGLIQGFGTINLTNQLVNTGTIRSTNTVAGGNGILYFANPGNILNIQQSGTLAVELGSQMIFGSNSNAPVANSGTILMDGGYFRSGTLTNSSTALITGYGTITSPLINLGLLNATNGTMTLTIAPVQTSVFDVQGGASAGTLNISTAWTNSGLVNISLGGVVSGGDLTNLSSGTVTNFGAISGLLANQGRVVFGGSAGNLLQSTPGSSLTVSGSGSVTGTATITGGVFDLAGQTYSNGFMIVGGTGVLTNGLTGATFNGGLSNNATVFVSADTFFNGSITNTGVMVFRGAISNSFVNSGAGAMTLTNAATITQNATVNGGVFNLNGQTYSNGFMSVGGTGVLTNGIAGATFNGGLSNNATVFVSADTFFNGSITNTGVMVFRGAISNSFVNSGAAVMTLTNAATITQNAIVNAGVFNLNGQTYSNGFMSVGGAGVLTNGIAGATFNGGLSNNGTVFVSTNTYFNGSITNTGVMVFQGAISNNFVNSGAGAMTLTNTATITQNAIVNAGVFNLNGQTYSNGLMTVAGTGVLTNGVAGETFNGGLSNNATVFVSANTYFNGAVTNTGVMVFQGAMSNSFVNSGGGSMTLRNSATFTQNATINGGAFNLNGQTSSNKLLTVSGTGVLTNGVVSGTTFNGALSNAATVAVTVNTFLNGPVNNTGLMNFQGAISNTLANSGSFNLNNNVTITAALVNKGTINIAANQLTENPAWVNNGSIVLSGGVLSGGTVTNGAGGFITAFGTINSSLVNAGTLLASGSAPLSLTGSTIYNTNSGFFGANNGQLIVNSVFTNAGTVSFMNSVGTFNSAVVNKGAWVSDPSTNVFYGDYTVATNGYIVMGAGDSYLFKSNFVNVSSLSNQYDTTKGQFTFNGNNSYTQSMYVAGLNLGGYISTIQSSNEVYFTNAFGIFSTNVFEFGSTTNDIPLGYTNNFALGTLQIGDMNDTSTLMLADSFAPQGPGANDGNVAGLYVNTLTIDPGSLLIISNNVELYFQNSNGVTGVSYDPSNLNGANVLILNGGSLHELTIVPEPSILMLLCTGSLAIFWYRRRRRAKLNT